MTASADIRTRARPAEPPASASGAGPQADLGDVAATFADCLARAELRPEPYPHWLLSRALPEAAAEAIAALPFDPPRIEDTGGKRDTNNQTRVYFSAENQARFPVCARLAE